ncbi:MAG: ChbG/HpnK family deacetylase, partial [Candidatus Hydrogenedentes bacterium]|nr:ChbG/HpnK family deacetylase [Candidatus Hydrogenedentota bacterium]
MEKRLPICLLILSIVACATYAQDTKPTYAERLGFPKGARVVLFHQDDAGMSLGQNQGTIQALEYGVLTSVSTMMPCPWVSHFAKYLKEHPNVDNGLHLTLTSEWDGYRWGPVAGKAAVPSLVDTDGCLWDNVALAVQHATGEDVEKEIRAQIDRAQTLGIPITHLDTHMGTLYAKPEFTAAYVKVGIEKQIPIMIMGGHLQFIGEDEKDIVKQLEVTKLAEMVWNGGLPVLDDLLNRTYDWKSFDEKKTNLLKCLGEMKPGLTMVIFHCAQPTEEWQHFTTSSQTRAADLKVMTDPDVKKFLDDNKFVLTTWRELMERRQKV